MTTTDGFNSHNRSLTSFLWFSYSMSKTTPKDHNFDNFCLEVRSDPKMCSLYTVHVICNQIIVSKVDNFCLLSPSLI